MCVQTVVSLYDQSIKVEVGRMKEIVVAKDRKQFEEYCRRRKQAFSDFIYINLFNKITWLHLRGRERPIVIFLVFPTVDFLKELQFCYFMELRR